MEMKKYKSINFSKVKNFDKPADEDTIRGRTEYIHCQLENEFSYTDDLENSNTDKLDYSQAIISIYRIFLVNIQTVFRERSEDPLILYRIEQTLGRAANHFAEPYYGFEADYKENLLQLRILAKQFSKHEQKYFKIASVSFLIAGLAAFLSLMLLSIPSASILIAFVALTNAILAIGDLCFSNNDKEKKLSKAINNLVDKAQNIEALFSYFDKTICPKLDVEDYEYLKNELLCLIKNGFNPLIIKNALIWANKTNEQAHAKYDSQREPYEIFFWRLADICCKSRINDYWINYQRIPKNYLSKQSSELISMKTSQDNITRGFFSTIGSQFNSSHLSNYCKQYIFPLLDINDSLCFDQGLKFQLVSSVDPSDLLSALKWAKYLYDHGELLRQSESSKYNLFFKRVSSICGVELEVADLAPARITI